MSAPRFVPFSGEHFVALAVVVGGSIALAVGVRATKSERLDRVVRWVLAVACVAYEGIEIPWRVIGDIAPLHLSLPLHLCDVSILIAPVVLLTANRYAFELLYFWGIGGAMQALLTPALLSGFPAPICIVFFLGHGLIIAGALHAAVVMRLRPTPWSIPRVWLITIAYGLLILPLNHLLGSNYLYIMRKPHTPSLLDLMGPWPWYLLTLLAVMIVVLCLCYLPFFVLDRREAREANGSRR